MVVLPLNPAASEDIRLTVAIWPTDTMKHELYFYYQHNEIDEAIRFAWTVSADWREIHKVTVVDAWGMLIAQFTAAWIYLGEDKFNDKKMGRRSKKPEIGAL